MLIKTFWHVFDIYVVTESAIFMMLSIFYMIKLTSVIVGKFIYFSRTTSYISL